MPIAQYMKLLAAILTIIILTSGCTDGRPGAPVAAPVFTHDFKASARPWTHEIFDAEDDKFTFALFSDLTGGEREHIFEVAVAQLSILRPEFIMNIGDLIEGGTTDRQQLALEWDSFDDRAKGANAPVFYTGGNHDLTNMTMREVWEERYGARYYYFTYRNVLFLVLDTEDNTRERMQEIFDARAEAIALVEKEGWGVFGDTEYSNMPEQLVGTIGAEQSDYFQQVIAEHPEVRWTFLFMHKAAWKKENETGFAAIEKALSERPYTLFHGHVHAYKHEIRHGRDYIRLATTGGVQFADRDKSIDHVTLVTVSGESIDIANLKMSGIFDKAGHIPLGGDTLCFDTSKCSNEELD